MSNQLTDTRKLYVFDTLHDFWKERGKTNEDDEDEDIDESKIEFIREFVLNFLYQKFIPSKQKSPDKNINYLLSTLTNNHVRSPTSAYERTVEKYYHLESSERDNLYYDTKTTLRYGDIIDAWDNWEKKGEKGGFPTLWTDYINSHGVSNVLDISPGNHPVYTDIGTIQRRDKEKIIANFVLNYMFPNFTKGENNCYITFDAGAKVVGKIFRNIENTFNLVTPANIADSATTSFKTLEGRNEYVFPTNTGTQVFDSNFYTEDSAKLFFTNKNFSVKNQFGFDFNINNNKFSFSPNQKQGPSVNYLIDLMLQAKTNKVATPSNSTIINMNSVADNSELVNNGLLLDMKRCGDYEQVNSAVLVRKNGEFPYTILSTVDILCALYSRLKKQNTIFHAGQTIALYRFPSDNIKADPKQQELQRLKYESEKTIQTLNILSNFISGGILEDIKIQNERFSNFIKNGVFSASKIASQLTRPEELVTNLIKIRIDDVRKLMNSIDFTPIEKLVSSIEPGQLEKEREILENYVNKMINREDIDDTLKEQVKTINQSPKIPLKEIIDGLNSKLNLTLNQSKILTEGGNSLGINFEFYTDIGNGKVKFKNLGECKSLNFSNKLFTEMFDATSKFDRIIDSLSKRGRDKNLHKKLLDMDYFNRVSQLYDSFYDKGIGEDVINKLQPSVFDDESIIGWYKNLLNDVKVVTVVPVTNYSDKMEIAGGAKREREEEEVTNEKLPNKQFYELSDLLRKISGIAAAFVESVITNHISDGTVPTPSELMRILLKEQNYYSATIETMNNISFVWENELMSIQNNMSEAYDYKPTESEYIILHILSYYFDSHSTSQYNQLDDAIINRHSNYYETNTTVFKKQRTAIGFSTQLNDIGTLYLTSKYPAEIMNILLLTLIDNTMQKSKDGYYLNVIKKNEIPINYFDIEKTWSSLPIYIHSYLSYIVTNQFPREAFKLLRGGKTQKNKQQKRRTRKVEKIKGHSESEEFGKTRKMRI
jgi:ribosomal protein L31